MGVKWMCVPRASFVNNMPSGRRGANDPSRPGPNPERVVDPNQAAHAHRAGAAADRARRLLRGRRGPRAHEGGVGVKGFVPF